MALSKDRKDDIDAVWIDDCPHGPLFFGMDFASEEDRAVVYQCDGNGNFAPAAWLTYAEFVQMQEPTLLPLEIGRIDGFRFIESPLVPQPEKPMNATRHIDSNSKRGRQLNSPKLKIGGRSYRGKPPGGKELERGARSYMVASQTNGYPIVQTMSKKQFDKHVDYLVG